MDVDTEGRRTSQVKKKATPTKGGRGRKAFKNMMPKMLHMELLVAAKK